jgi:hypothetical protein
VTIFELLFTAALVALILGLITCAFRWTRGNSVGALELLRLLTVWTALYLTVDIAVAVLSPRESHKAGVAQCFDDWCIRPIEAYRTPTGLVEITMELSSRAKRISQGEQGTVAYLLDLEGHRYDAVPEEITVPFDTMLEPGQSVMAVRLFRVPVRQNKVNFVYEHDGFPIQLFIIGQAGSWIHGPPITSLEIR